MPFFVFLILSFRLSSNYIVLLHPKIIINHLNMKKYLMFIAMALFIGAMTSCSTKQTAMNQLEDFSIELKNNSENYDLQQWKGALDQFIKIRKKISKHHYTSTERMQIGLTEGRCIGYIASGAKKGAFYNLTGFSSEIKGIIDGVMESEAK